MWAHGLENAAFPDPERPDKFVQFLGWVVGKLLFYHRMLILAETIQY